MIGIFDSGFGGLSVYLEAKKRLPGECFIYLADQANFPYGSKTKQELFEIASSNANFLINQGAKIIVIACNTATVSTINELRLKFNIPFIGIVPTIKKADKLSNRNNIAVLASRSTIKSNYIENLAEKLELNCSIQKVDGTSLIKMIENDHSNISNQNLLDFINIFKAHKVDVVALGCTHFHYVHNSFKRLAPEITFLNPGAAVARHLKKIILAENLTTQKNGKDFFHTSGDLEKFKHFLNTKLKLSANDVNKL